MQRILKSDAVDVFFISRPTAIDDKAHALLSASETKRLATFKSVKRANEFVFARSMLRQLLSEYLQLSPAEIPITTTESGQPILAMANQPLYFNLSHSCDFIAICISQTAPLGIDIEKMQPRPFLPIAHKYFSKHENIHLHGLAQDAKELYFYQLWTAKEAIAKACGKGISFGFKTIELPLLGIPTPFNLAGLDLKIIPLAFASSQYYCTLVCNHRIKEVNLWKHSNHAYVSKGQISLA